MSQENVDVLKRGMECFERHDVEAVIELLDPEVEWHPAFTALLGGETTVFRGHDGARDVIRQFWEVFSETHFEVSEIRGLSDQALAIGTMHARGAESGAEIESPWAWLVRSRNGKATSIRVFTDPTEAIAAAAAMSEENVEVVRRLFAAFQDVDVDSIERRLDDVREIIDPEVEWVAAPHSLLASEEYRGYDGVRRFWSQFLSAWDEYSVQVDELIDAGDQVVAVMRLSGRTNELEVDEARSSLLTLRDGRIVRIEPFASKDSALEAAGLRE